MEYVNRIKAKRRLSKPLLDTPDPVLSPDDEAFLQRLTAEQQSGSDIVRPATSAEVLGRELEIEDTGQTSEVLARTSRAKKRQSWGGLRWNFLRAKDDDDNNEQRHENEDMTEVLEKLNLAAVNNRAFSISDETQELLDKFKFILKDILTGVPTAYNDLESLLKNSNGQLQRTYSKLPSFLTKLIEKLPEKWTQYLAPEVIAATSEKIGRRTGVNADDWDRTAATANKMGMKIPSVRELVSKPAAVIGLLRSIISFLKTRFPAVMGMNVLWSMALFILLFVLWYCHKRGREVRLQNDASRLLDDKETTTTTDSPSWYDDDRPGTVTPEQPMAMTESRADILRSRRSSVISASMLRNPTNSSDDIHASAAPIPQRMKSQLSTQWSRLTRNPTITRKIQPYPGT